MSSVQRRWEEAPDATRAVLDARALAVLSAAGVPVPPGASAATLVEALERLLSPAAGDLLWLALAVLTGRLPAPGDVLRARRRTQLDGPLPALDDGGLGAVLAGGGPRNAAGALPTVRVVQDAVLIDVHETAQAAFHTGIQRVARETARRWAEDHAVVLVGWDLALPALRELTVGEQRGATHGERCRSAAPLPDDVVVPWRSRYVLPELVVDPARTSALHGLFACSGNRSLVIGHDCVPLTTVEVVGGWEMADAFAHNLAAVAHATSVAATCQGSAREYSGWRRMLVGTGLPGPRIEVVRLADQVRPAAASETAQAPASYQVADLPLVLVVGSHEPRKNHLAVLHAAEVLWGEGVAFSLTFVGGNAWSSGPFERRLAELAGRGRPVSSVSGAADDELWAAYRVARCTVFPSLNEGFGLPLAESLAAGTPAVTSGFGSMREIADGGGALLVDPRDSGSIADALRRLLTDDVLLHALRTAARMRPRRSWDDYAAELWAALPAAVA